MNTAATRAADISEPILSSPQHLENIDGQPF